jgi:hypothetical protein
MKRAATTMIVLLVALVASASLIASASAALRVPQVPVLGGSLQAYFNSVPQTINVNTDQDATQAWTHTSSNTTTYTVMFEATPNANVLQFGLYNASAVIPPLFFLLSGSVGPQGFSTATFKPGNILVVNRFDALANFLSTTTFGGVDPTNFGFYLSSPNGTFFTEDARNPGGKAQALAYQGTGAAAGTWWLCFDDQSVAAGSDQDYDDLVIMMESVNTTPVNKTTWGQLKARFR